MPVKRHQHQIIPSSAKSPRRISRDQLAEDANLEARRAEVMRNYKPAIMTREGLIDAGFLKPGKVRLF